MTYYLGALGALAALPDPEAGLSLTPERIGLSHQLLSGAKVRDTIGYSRQWQLSWTAITLAQYGLLEGFYYGATGGGPYYFVDDEQTNLLPLNVSTGTDATGDTTGFLQVNGATIASQVQGATLWNTLGGPFPANGSRTLVTTVPNAFANNQIPVIVSADVPVVGGVSYTFSVYLRSASTNVIGAYGQINWRDASLSTITTNSGNTITPAAQIGRSTVTAVSPTTAVSARLQYLITPANTSGSSQFIYTDGWQFEMNSSASTWQPGVAVPLVTVESLSRSTPLAGICDAQMTLVQVG